MDKEANKLFEVIRNEIHNFELPYEEGRWEDFQLFKKKSSRPALLRSIIRKPAAAAAVLFLLFLYIQGFFKMRDEGKSAVEERLMPAKTETRESGQPSSLPVTIKRGEGRELPAHMKTLSAFVQKTPLSKLQNRLIYDDSLSGISDSRPGLSNDVFPLPTVTAVPLQAVHVTALPRMDGWKIKETRETAYASPVDFGHEKKQAAPESRWKLGFAVGSSFSSEKMNMEAGLVSRFAFSNKIGLSGGLIYSRISGNYKTDPVQNATGATIVKSQTHLQVMDLPLAVHYRPVEGWYASAGVSVSAVLEEKKVNSMEAEVLRENSVTDPQTGEAVTVFIVEKEKFTKKADGRDFKGQGNLNYVNFSFGRELFLSKKTELMLEPFVKIPVGAFAKDDVNLLQSGVRLKVVF